MKRSINRLTALAAILVACVAICACQEKIDTPQVELNLRLKKDSSDKTAGSTFVYVEASGNWTLSINEEGRSWARLSDSTGTSSRGDVVLSWDANTASEARTLTLTLVCNNAQKSAVFSQTGTSSSEGQVTVLEADPVKPWMELPATTDPTLYFFTHPMTIDGVLTRNFSFYYDPVAHLSVWVAYPLNSALLAGSGGRSEAWAYDPKVPEKYQIRLHSGFSESGTYARGHQIPSADRKILEYNMQTYYFTNMTPQRHAFNEGVWAKLETYVRDVSSKFDTLYVVTGCTTDGSTEVAHDKDGMEVTIPTGYYKALLGYSKKGSVGITPTTAGYTAVGFYFPHTGYSSTYMASAMTISELEKKVGVDFFCNLEAAIGSTLYSKVESTKDNWWYNN